MRFLANLFKKKTVNFINEQDISNRYYVEHILLPAMILGENGHHLETINRILKEKGNLFINLYAKLNSDVPNYKCPYSAEQFSVECSRIADIHWNEFYVLKIKMPPPEKEPLCSMIIITYNENMTSRKYITTERGYENKYYICEHDAQAFSHGFLGTYSEEDLLKVLKGDYNYSLAPKTEIKRRLVDFFTNWEYPINLFVGIACMMFLTYTTKSLFGEYEMDFIIPFLLSIPMYLIFKQVNLMAKDYVNEQAMIEIYERNFSYYSAFPNHESKIKKIRSKVSKKAFKLGSVLILVNSVLITLTIMSICFSITDIKTVAGDALDEDKIYYIEDLYILASYTQEQKEPHTYYVAAFTDKKGDPYLLSFDPSENDNINTFIAKTSGLRISKGNILSVSAYVEVSDLSGTLRDLFKQSLNLYNSHNKYFYITMNAKYICSPGENIILKVVTGKFSFLLAATLLFMGVCIFLKAIFIRIKLR